MTSDASGSWGCGAWQGTNWFQLKWDEQSASRGIAPVKELLPIIVATVVWGHGWKGKQVCFQCDNSAYVEKQD